MLERIASDVMSWWATVTPEFAFLLALPFVVGLLGLCRDGRARLPGAP
jgi:hypothetical protein